MCDDRSMVTDMLKVILLGSRSDLRETLFSANLAHIPLACEKYPAKLFLLLFNLDNRTGDFHRKQNMVNMVKALFGYTCIHLNPCILEWIGVELCLISTTIPPTHVD
jgi:hypothetical protein